MMDNDLYCPYCHTALENVDDFLFGEIHTCENCDMAFVTDFTEIGLMAMKSEVVI